MTNKTAFVFPGQGSQSVSMLQDLHDDFAIIKDTFQIASDVLSYDAWSLVSQGPAEDLNQTHNTQPMLLAASVAIWRLWNEQGGAKPALMAGHSLGEYSALVCANALSFEDALKLVKLRGEFMQQSVPAGQGKMAAIIGLDNESIENICSGISEQHVVSAANYNSPGQVVIAGSVDGVTIAAAACKEAGAKRALLLDVSVPSHCLLMKPAAEKLSEELKSITISTPEFSVINNVNAKIETDADAIRGALVEQLFRPVRWVSVIEGMVEQGVDVIYECGPGKVLTGLTKRIHKPLQCLPLQNHSSFTAALES